MRKSLYLINFIIISAVLFGCASMIDNYKIEHSELQQKRAEELYAGKIKVSENKFTDMKTTIFDEDNVVLNGGKKHYGNFMIVKSEDLKADSTSYFLRFNYFAKKWIFINKGESLIILLNGKDRIAFNSIEGSEGQRNMQSNYFNALIAESANYSVSLDMINRIFYSDTIEFYITGNAGTIAGNFSEQNILNCRRFIEEYLK